MRTENQNNIGYSYSEVTRDILVEVRPQYLEHESRPEISQFLFSYNVTIFNQSHKTLQLISRHWIITDGNGKVEEVKGPGVIGEQPILKPGQSHSYQSFCPLRTPTGNMRGTYQMLTIEDERFDIKIPLFFLRSDLVLH